MLQCSGVATYCIQSFKSGTVCLAHHIYSVQLRTELCIWHTMYTECPAENGTRIAALLRVDSARSTEVSPATVLKFRRVLQGE
jgi:hypothetical protein